MSDRERCAVSYAAGAVHFQYAGEASLIQMPPVGPFARRGALDPHRPLEGIDRGSLAQMGSPMSGAITPAFGVCRVVDYVVPSDVAVDDGR